MRIRMLFSMWVRDAGQLDAGEEYDVTERLGNELVEAHSAERIDEPEKKPAKARE